MATCEIAQVAAGRQITSVALAEGGDRARLLKRFRALPQQSLRKAARKLGVSQATLCRLRQVFGHLRDEEITAEVMAPKWEDCGQTSAWELLAQDPAVRQALLTIYTATIGASCDEMTRERRTGSMALTLHRFADHELCPPRLAKALRRGAQPKPLVNVIRQITPGVEAKIRGPKHFSLSGTLIHRRELVEIMGDGSASPINLGDWWVFDDMSTNAPFWFAGPDESPWIGRQGLYAYDVRQQWLGLEHIGTSRDSYTAAIILRFIRRLMQALGKPRRGIVLERSVWAARSIAGFRISKSGVVFEEEVERNAMSDADKAMLQEGIKALGIEVHYTYTPRGKEIEGAFNYLQRVFGTFVPQDAVIIGRHAGEFEHGAKQLRRARGSAFHPEDLGFLHIDRHADLSEQTMQWINNRKAWNAGEDLEVSPSENPVKYPELGPLTERDLAAFMPDVFEETIRGGKIVVKVNKQVYEFCAPELFARLGAGYRIAGRFDVSESSLGAAIYNREPRDAASNLLGMQVGQFMGWAEFLPPVPRFVWGESAAADKAGELKKRHNGFVRTTFRTVGLPRHKAATARDGKGNVAVVGNSDAGRSTELPRRVAAPEPAPRINRELLARQAARSRQQFENA
ncbi:MAG TPA: hypothetical protein VHB20_14520 [Verrucomicrobiae bacterium]|nr:hypothetical protein [Verrucomicrobiae bacterium]